MDVYHIETIADLFTPGSIHWSSSMAIRTFEDIMGFTILFIVLSIHLCTNIRLWRSSIVSEVSLSDLYPIFNSELLRRLDIGWI